MLLCFDCQSSSFIDKIFFFPDYLIMIEKVQFVGVLNTTPDSYVDGGQYVTVEAAVERAGVLLAEGADIIEIGGESTGPHSQDVSLEEELRRTIPVIEAIKTTYPSASVSIDTYKAKVAQAAIEAGVEMVNDITAGRSDPDMFTTVAAGAVDLVMMYSKDMTPRTTVAATSYQDVVAQIIDFFTERIEVAKRNGIKPHHIIVDPGLGHFISNDPTYSLQIIAQLGRFQSLGYPLFISPSRKSFLAGIENLKTVDRLPGTITASALACVNGATYIRTHDVKDVRRGCEIALAITAST